MQQASKKIPLELKRLVVKCYSLTFNWKTLKKVHYKPFSFHLTVEHIKLYKFDIGNYL